VVPPGECVCEMQINCDAAAAVNRGQYEYELWLRTDLYTEKHTQWYYFRVSNTQPNVTYRFTIVNFIKVSQFVSLYFQFLSGKY